MFAAIKQRARAFLSDIRRFFAARAIARFFLVWGFFFLCFLCMYFAVTTLSSGDDHYFHFRFASLFAERGFFESFREFHAISVSKISEGQYFVYYNFLFYLALIPFAKLVPLYLGIKLYAVAAASLAFATLYWCLRQFAVARPFFWTLALGAFAGTSMFWRLFLSRPYVLAPALLLLLLVALHRKRHWWAAAVCFAYLFWHGTTFFLPLGVAVAYMACAQLYTPTARTKALLLYPLLGVAAAMGAAYAVSRGFLHYVYDVLSVYSDTIIGKKVLLLEGGELYPVSLFEFVSANQFFFTLFIMAACAHLAIFRAWRAHHEDDGAGNAQPTLRMALFLISGAFFAATVLVSRRFGDFFMFAGWAFVAVTFTGIAPLLTVANRAVRRALVAGAALCVAYLFVSNLLALQHEFAGNGSAPEEFEKAGTWLAEHVPPGGVVFNPSWDWFPQLYYYSPRTNFVTGLEPRLTYVADERRYWLWFNAGKGYVCPEESCPELATAAQRALRDEAFAKEWYREQGDALATMFAQEFNSRFVVTASPLIMLNEALDASARFELGYGGEGKRYSVYRLVD